MNKDRIYFFLFTSFLLIQHVKSQKNNQEIEQKTNSHNATLTPLEKTPNVLVSLLGKVSGDIYSLTDNAIDATTSLIENISPQDVKFRKDKPVDFDNVTLGGDWMWHGFSGFCPKETTYTITSTEDLDSRKKELECIFARGEAPLRPPLGMWCGKVHSIFDKDLFEAISENFWAGKLAALTQCRHGDSKFYLIMNFFSNKLEFPALAYIGKLKDPMVPGERNDEKDQLIVDYTVRFDDLCPVNPKFGSHNINFGIMNGGYPLNLIVDLVRLVGKTPDGGYILLGKAIMRDPVNLKYNGDRTIAWWSVVIYDDEAFAQKTDWSLSPLEESFHYQYASGIEFVSRLLMLDGITKDLLGTKGLILDHGIRRPLGLQSKTKKAKEYDRTYVLAGTPKDGPNVLSQNNTQAPILNGGFFSGRVSYKDLRES